uniref:Hydrolase_4 domain-containing protein n=1 Tax=Parastrongyloides trichosuri TaxID=131310 RepID=A0A0N4ZNK2_PARTI
MILIFLWHFILVFLILWLLKYVILLLILFDDKTNIGWIILKTLRKTNNYDPTNTDLRNLTRNFYLTMPNKETVAVWHTLPNSISDEMRKHKTKLNSSAFELALSNNTNHKVFIYCHGVLGYRGNTKSVELINFMGDRDAHSFAIDYRGFADTTGEFSEVKCYEDLKFVYKYVHKFAPNRIGLWGHGMGAAIAAKVAAELSEEGIPPTSVVLESPFTNFLDAVLELPLISSSRLITPYLKKFLQYFPQVTNKMATDRLFTQIGCLIVLLHSKDDSIYPYYMSQQLYLLARENEMTCRLYLFDESFGLGHFNIIKTPDMKHIYNTIVATDT